MLEGDVYGWKNELRDPASERPGVYAVDKARLVFKAEGGDDYNGAKAWVAVTLTDNRKGPVNTTSGALAQLIGHYI